MTNLRAGRSTCRGSIDCSDLPLLQSVHTGSRVYPAPNSVWTGDAFPRNKATESVNVILFFFHWHYSPLWALACRTNFLPFFSCLPQTLHHLTPSTWWSLSASSFHLFLGLPLLLVPSSSWVKIFLGILSSSILSRWPNQPILCPFIHFIRKRDHLHVTTTLRMSGTVPPILYMPS